MKPSPNTKAVNKKAHFNYDLKEDLEAGIVLTGLEIKAIRDKKVDLTGSHVKIIGNEAFLLGSKITWPGLEVDRTRKLLLHKEQISRLIGLSSEKGLSIIPLKIYLKKGRAKILISTGKGKKLFDKREDLKKKDLQREQQRNF